MVEVCRYHKMGYCKYKEHCRYMHIDEICEENTCDITLCRKRHPKTCYYYEKYGRCKFGSYCKFLHKEPHVIETCENERLVNKITEIEILIKEKDSNLGTWVN